MFGMDANWSLPIKFLLLCCDVDLILGERPFRLVMKRASSSLICADGSVHNFSMAVVFRADYPDKKSAPCLAIHLGLTTST